MVIRSLHICVQSGLYSLNSLNLFPCLLQQHTLLVLFDHSLCTLSWISCFLFPTLNTGIIQVVMVDPYSSHLRVPVFSFMLFVLVINKYWWFLNLFGLKCYIVLYSTNIFQNTVTVWIGLEGLLAASTHCAIAFYHNALCWFLTITLYILFPLLFTCPSLLFLPPNFNQTLFEHLSVRSRSLHHERREIYSKIS